jgi:hypothetical protein
MAQFRVHARSSLVFAGLLASTLIAVGQGPVSADHRTGTAVKGSASGIGYNAGLFGGVNRVGPTPFVKLAPDASNSPQTANEETFHDGVITAGSPTLTSASANFTLMDTNRPITGAGIPAGTTIKTVNRPNTFSPTTNSITLSANATTTAAGMTFTIVDRIVNMQFGPGIIFRAHGMTVETSGTVGPNWSVTSTAAVQDVNQSRIEIFGEDRKDCCRPQGSEGQPGDFLPDVEGSPTMTRPLTDIASTCSASGAGLSGSTTIANGWLYTDNGWYDNDLLYPEPFSQTDLNNDGDFDDEVNNEKETQHAEHDPVKVALPNSPAVGATYIGHLHIGTSSGSMLNDHYVVVFNEQIVKDGTITVNAAHFYYGYRLEGGNLVVDQGSQFKGEMVLGQSVCGVPHTAPRADFNGNGTSDISVFRPSTGAWFARNQPTVFLGAGGDVPVPCDYNGDGSTDEAVFRPSVGGWYVEGQNPVFFGLSGDIPVPGDYNGDGQCDRAVFRPSVGGWYIHGQNTAFFGLDGDIPVPGDYNGDGRTDVSIFRPSVGGWYRAGVTTTFMGLNGDVPVPGDYDGDETTDIAIYRPAVGAWYVNGQNGRSPQFLGLSGDIPQPGDYDGNGTADLAVYRPSSGAWYVGSQAAVFHGTTGDLPLPLPSAIRMATFP